jgi:hypothetical protein
MGEADVGVSVQMASEGGTPADAGGPPGSRCGMSVMKVADYLLDVPAAGQATTEVPDIAVSESGLYYVVNWTAAEGTTSSDLRNGYLIGIVGQARTHIRMANIPGGGGTGSQALVVTASAVVFSQAPGFTMDGGGVDGGAIVSVSKGDAGAISLLASTAGPVKALVADTENVYFVDSVATKRVPLLGGAVETIANATPSSLGIAGQTLYLADEYGTTVSAVPTAGGQATVLASNQAGPEYPVPCGAGFSSLCWANTGTASAAQQPNGALMELGASPGSAPVTIISGLVGSDDLIYDGTTFFVTSGFLGGLTQISSDGRMAVADFIGEPARTLAIDRSCLYWAGAEGVWSIARSAADVVDGTDQ